MPHVNLESLQIGRKYERPELAALWGYTGFQALSRGVVTPAGQRLILLFVTRIKQRSLTPYADSLDGNVLTWEGEERHGSDRRIVRAAESGDEIHLFYREVHHTPFEYKGPIELETVNELVDRPSEFRFRLVHDQSEVDDLRQHASELEAAPETERQALVDARVGQGRFREELFQLWGGCSVTGVSVRALVLASHIKPWRLSTNQERLDRHNGLLLIPNYDLLFDRGFLSFDTRGACLISPVFGPLDRIAFRLPDVSNCQLRMLPSRTGEYLEFHREQVFIAPSATLGA